MITAHRRSKLFTILELGIIVLLAVVPLFLTFPYRVNIFLSWEGAYRLSEGQVPYRDFGMPLGYMYWVVPALFFKIFGAQLITLVKAQVLINIVSGLAFRSILKSLGVQPGIRLLSVLLYCVSFSFFNFWPWYNHTVIVYQFAGLAFLFAYFFREKKNWIFLSLGALFTFFSFFTKQDGGGLALLLALALTGYYCLHHKNWKPLGIFVLSYAVTAFACIAPLLRYHFGYWFNFGQPPHTARIAPMELLNEFFISSQWIKFYMFLILLLAMATYRSGKEILQQKRSTMFLLLTLGILAEAAILQVTSYTPPDNNIFFHAFAFAFILSGIATFFRLDFMHGRTLLAGAFGLLLWWSGVFWKYVQRIVERAMPPAAAQQASGENIVNRNTYMLNRDTTEIPVSEWTFSKLASFEKIYMPSGTVAGMERLMNLPGLAGRKDLKVLNMTELTPLAVELPFAVETGSEVPLWHHLGVGMFNREAAMYEARIRKGHYDLVLFEYIPSLNNFFPFRTRDTLAKHYVLKDKFPAPRRGNTQGIIEVYQKQ